MGDGHAVLTRDAFDSCWFQLADLNTQEVDATAYGEWIRTAIGKLTRKVGGGGSMPETTVWRTDEDMVRELRLSCNQSRAAGAAGLTQLDGWRRGHAKFFAEEFGLSYDAWERGLKDGRPVHLDELRLKAENERVAVEPRRRSKDYGSHSTPPPSKPAAASAIATGQPHSAVASSSLSPAHVPGSTPRHAPSLPAATSHIRPFNDPSGAALAQVPAPPPAPPPAPSPTRAASALRLPAVAPSVQAALFSTLRPLPITPPAPPPPLTPRLPRVAWHAAPHGVSSPWDGQNWRNPCMTRGINPYSGSSSPPVLPLRGSPRSYPHLPPAPKVQTRLPSLRRTRSLEFGMQQLPPLATAAVALSIQAAGMLPPPPQAPSHSPSPSNRGMERQRRRHTY